MIEADSHQERPVLIRLHAVQAELREQRTRLERVLEACRTTTSQLGPEADAHNRPRLFAREVLRLGDVELLVRQQAVRDGRLVRRLTPTEWQLLTFLLSHPDVVHTREEVAAGAWGQGFMDRRSEVEVYISRLRRKLGSAAPLLETVRGQGYRLTMERGLLGRGQPTAAEQN
jgi:DNA-binding response OmpR family regulator